MRWTIVTQGAAMGSRTHYGLSPGDRMGRYYRVLEFLGKGWEGEVYKVEECSTGIIRAAKLFYKRHNMRDKPHIAYAKRLNQLKSCPIVIKYHHQDVVEIDGQAIDFLVSDFVDGELLSHYIAKQRGKCILPFKALHLFYALLQGVEHIHFMGNYHGDIHSENIIISRRGLVFDVHLIDLLHLGRSTRAQIQQDVYDLINIFYEMIGGHRRYGDMPDYIKSIILGRRHQLISRRFKTAGHLRLFVENLELV